jgi:nucleoside-diphosphate-sugar epimerase
MKIMITGATGHSGRWFIQRLIKEKFDGELVCLVRKGREISHLESSGLNYKIIWGSIQNEETLNDAMKGMDTVIHIAGIQMSRQILNVAIANDVNWAILVHTTGRYSEYKRESASYIEIEDEILTMRDRMNITIVRPTMIYGSAMDANMHKLILYLNKHKFFPLFGKGDNLMQPVHARDLGNAYYDILTHREKTLNKEYNLSGKEPWTYLNIVSNTSHFLGKRHVIFRVPLWVSVNAARIYNALLRDKAIISVEQVLRLQENKDFSHEEARKDFGYNPIAFEEGIREEIESMKKDGLI